MTIDIDKLYRKWEKQAQKPELGYLSLKGLYQWFMRETERKGVDPQAIDFEAYVDPALTYEENKTIIADLIKGGPYSDSEIDEIYAGYKADMELEVREKYPEIIEPLEDRIIELERTEKTSKQRFRKIKELKQLLSETQKMLEAEKARPPEIAPIKIRFVKSFSEGILKYAPGAILETKDIDWALEKITRGYAVRERGEMGFEPTPPPLELSSDSIARLRSEFNVILYKKLGKVPRIAADRFNVEMDALKFLPFEDALKSLELIAEDISREALVPPRLRPTKEKPIRKVTERPREIEGIEEFVVHPVDLPPYPKGDLPFPRGAVSEEKDVFWRHFKYAMAEMGKDYTPYIKAFEERLGLPYRSWSDLLKTYQEFLESVKAGEEVVMIPLYRIPMPWTETKTEDDWRFDAIVHFLATKIYDNMDDLIQAIFNHGVSPPPTPEEIQRAAKKAWDTKNLWFTSVTRADLEQLGLVV